MSNGPAVSEQLQGDRWMPEVAPTFRLQWEKSQGCYVILYPEGMIQLSPSAGNIMSRCNGSRNVNEIIQTLQVEYMNNSLGEDVRNFLQEALRNGWIQASKHNKR